jgi:hypothetical protein
MCLIRSKHLDQISQAFHRPVSRSKLPVKSSLSMTGPKFSGYSFCTFPTSAEMEDLGVIGFPMKLIACKIAPAHLVFREMCYKQMIKKPNTQEHVQNSVQVGNLGYWVEEMVRREVQVLATVRARSRIVRLEALQSLIVIGIKVVRKLLKELKSTGTMEEVRMQSIH